MPVIQVSSSYGDALWGRVASEGSKLRTAEAAVGRGARESCQFRSFRPTDPLKQLAFGQDYRPANPARCAFSGHSRRCQGRFRDFDSIAGDPVAGTRVIGGTCGRTGVA
jgi:hypothetical protein